MVHLSANLASRGEDGANEGEGEDEHVFVNVVSCVSCWVKCRGDALLRDIYFLPPEIARNASSAPCGGTRRQTSEPRPGTCDVSTGGAPVRPPRAFPRAAGVRAASTRVPRRVAADAGGARRLVLVPARGPNVRQVHRGGRRWPGFDEAEHRKKLFLKEVVVVGCLCTG